MKGFAIWFLFSIVLAAKHGIDAFECTAEGYKHYLSENSYGIKRDLYPNHEEDHREIFINNCELMKKKNHYTAYDMDFSYLFDLSSDALTELMDITPHYTGSGSWCEKVDPIEPHYQNEYMVVRDFTKDEFEFVEDIDKCSTSWATQVIKIAESLVKKEKGMEVKLSSRYLMKCLPPFLSLPEEDACRGFNSKDIFAFVASNGLITEEYAKELERKPEGDLCAPEETKTFTFEALEINCPNKGNLMNLIANGNNVHVMLALDLEKMRYINKIDGDDDASFTGATMQPTVWATVTGYQDSNENGEDGYWKVETNVSPFETIYFKLPLRNNTNNANYAGIAGYAYSLALGFAPTTSAPPTAAPGTMFTVTLKRTYKQYASDEAIKLFEGTTTTGTPVFELSGSYNTANTEVTQNIVLTNTKYTILMTDSHGDGWSAGSQLEVLIDGVVFHTFTFNSGNTYSAELDLRYVIPLTTPAPTTPAPTTTIAPTTPAPTTTIAPTTPAPTTLPPLVEVTITSFSQFDSIPSFTTNITFANNIGNELDSSYSLNFTRFPFLKRIEIGDACFQHVREFVIDGLESLESVKIGKMCFTIYKKERDDGVCRITNCPNLRQLEIGDLSFLDFHSFELSNVDSLQSIKFGHKCFQYVREFVIDGLESLESVKIDQWCFGVGSEERDDGLCRITNCPKLRQLEIGLQSFLDFKSFELSNLNSLQSIKFGYECFLYANDFSLKDLPSLEIVTFGGKLFKHCHVAVFENLPKLHTISFVSGYGSLGLDYRENRKTIINGHESYNNTLIMKNLPSLTKIKGYGGGNHACMGYVILENIPNLTENNIDYGIDAFYFTADLQATNAPALEKYIREMPKATKWW